MSGQPPSPTEGQLIYVQHKADLKVVGKALVAEDVDEKQALRLQPGADPPQQLLRTSDTACTALGFCCNTRSAIWLQMCSCRCQVVKQSLVQYTCRVVGCMLEQMLQPG